MVKYNYSDFTSDHGNVRRYKKPICVAKYGLHPLQHTWERNWPIGNGSQLKAMCSVATILMNRPILAKTCLNFILINSPNHRCDNTFGRFKIVLFAHTLMHSVACNKLNNCQHPNESSHSLNWVQRGCKHVSRIRLYSLIRALFGCKQTDTYSRNKLR